MVNRTTGYEEPLRTSSGESAQGKSAGFTGADDEHVSLAKGPDAPFREANGRGASRHPALATPRFRPRASAGSKSPSDNSLQQDAHGAGVAGRRRRAAYLT